MSRKIKHTQLRSRMKTTKFQKALQILLYMFLDILAIVASYMIAIFMFSVVEKPVDYDKFIIALPLVIVLKIIVFMIFGMYRMVIRHVGFEDVIKISLIATASNVAIVLFITFSQVTFMYRSAFIFITTVEVALLVVTRVYHRIVNYVKTNVDWTKALGRRTLIIGAGDAGELTVKEIYRNKDLNNIPVLFLDDDDKKIGKRIVGIKIAGPISNVQNIIDEYKIEEVIIAITDYSDSDMKTLIEHLAEKNVRIRRLISMSDISNLEKTKIVEIKIEDLLNRDVIELEDDRIASFIEGEVVLVTGGGGSIGSELCRQIVELNPKQLVIFDIYENNAYDIQMELLRKFSKMQQKINLEVRIGSVYNYQRLETIFKEFRPTVVFHAAAYKHVPLMEDSAVEAVRTNVIGTDNTASLAVLYKVKNFVLVSSDKAVRSTNIMGATKNYAEKIIKQKNNSSEFTSFSSVRFGNVLGSNGSVIPLFQKQIADGGPVTVTHREITRYFMTIPEAVGLILQCAVYAKGGEVFILDMGKPVTIYELAEKMISLAGLRPHEDIKIEVTGLRPGEKLYEELLVDGNDVNQCRTDNDKIYIEKQNGKSDADLAIAKIVKDLEKMNNAEIKAFVSSVVDSYVINGH